ncbi:RNA 2'-phosphotransferase [Slackia heliotrinireducens]|uniref:Probable RNA 2'-phosphotransferase n=1 Tax=Slackia heliotrinireducens (strain ATCC 29202 / DSM 20476 / NCTC 11029 / RHS 1) TaxID=471855 RepID=C7N2Z0_SLAHD|nr:RNA 2'-phosphotransferase [Slackia heliotrinireducens]ACV21511.1 RNA:NAD 2'-phosphotransferase [Slackia heliotrinireducens DSM 20476]VEG98968.1 RNA 2'-phosphotransferase [Slackia heliotrinireducens]
MPDPRLDAISRHLSYLLRHHPEAAGLHMDEHGWVRVDELVAAVAQKHSFDQTTLERIVATDKKGRYSFNEDRTLIRANQGHSIPVDVELACVTPPDRLFHGTATRFAESIERQGLLPQNRLYVHLSPDPETAMVVGARHGKPMVYVVDAKAMSAAGHRFFLSVNGVWLVKTVPPEYLTRM